MKIRSKKQVRIIDSSGAETFSLMCQALDSIHVMCAVDGNCFSHTVAASAIFSGHWAGRSALYHRDELPVCRDGEEGALCSFEYQCTGDREAPTM